MGRHSPRSVSVLTAVYTQSLIWKNIDPTIEHSCMSFGFYKVWSFNGHFRDAVATDIVHQHSGRLDYYKGYGLLYGLLKAHVRS